jgi:hypothetical protein
VRAIAARKAGRMPALPDIFKAVKLSENSARCLCGPAKGIFREGLHETR